jgi:DNA-binding response OmpR family regulator
MRVLVLCANPESNREDPGAASVILEDLGCRVTLGRFDLSDLQGTEIARRPPTIVVVDAQDETGLAKLARRALTVYEPLLDTPTLLVTSIPRLSAIDFSMGFTDFIISPILPAELYARLRQIDWRTAAFGSDEIIKVGELVIDIAGYEVHLSGRPIEFTHQEFELLRFLAENRGRVYSREQLLQRVWGYEYGGGTRTVDIHIRRVRSKLDSNTAGMIVTVRNVGYKMR